VSAPDVPDQSLPGSEFISGMGTGLNHCQRRVFPASTPDILAIPEFSGNTGIFWRYWDFLAIPISGTRAMGSPKLTMFRDP